MRRTRNRYYTIDAENEEEFIKEIESKTKSRLSILAFKDEGEKIPETDEEEALSPTRKKKSSFVFNDLEEDGEYSGLGPLRDLDDEEDNLGPECEDDDIIKESEDEIIKKDNNEDKGIEILCYYLKNSINVDTKDKKNSGEKIFYNNNSMNALSGNAIYDLNIRDLVDNILTENDNEYNK